MPYLSSDTPCPEPLDCRILTAALQLFVAKGYHSVSIHEIQKLADVSIGSIYKHFGGKEGVAKALYQHLLKELQICIDEVKEDCASPWQQCLTLIRRLFDYTESHRDIMAFVFHSKHREYLPEATPLLTTPPFLDIRQMIESSMAQQEIRQMDSTLCMAKIFGCVEQLIQLRLERVIKQPLAQHLEAVTTMLETGLRR